eukprot:CAMPEP_0172445274 /NCGR_PEP_ID=MMETSP1065-20121228/5143_1 /TAXON_ID=265537 /ORGANISM="Amphiprora paludosa, Strain CCMP125" /LENGTH=176 /DNA_ID=CAMNT_0013196073 /DNA_START=6 /DNA_END=536 /DNA_ORIENTATION=-
MTRFGTFCLFFACLAACCDAWSASNLSRRDLLQQAAALSSAAAAAVPSLAMAAPTDEYLQELTSSRSKLQEIPDLLQAQEWEKVRNILKTPPVNKLWNLGDSQNTVLKLAKESGNVDLFELKDELAYNLQITDQLTYDNVFVYFQPGSGKIKIKEPTQSANNAIAQLDLIMAQSKE